MNKKKQDEIDLYRELQELVDLPVQDYDIAGIEVDTGSELICECHVVSFDDLAAFVVEKKCVDLTQISQELRVGTGCRSCLKTCGTWLIKLDSFI